MKVLLLLLFAGTALWSQSASECEELTNHFFPEAVVREVLRNYRVSYGSAQKIMSYLKQNRSEIPILVQKKASTLERNPFNPPEMKMVIGRLEYEVTFDLFTKILEEEGIKDARRRFEMYEQVQNLRAEKLWRCQQVIP